MVFVRGSQVLSLLIVMCIRQSNHSWYQISWSRSSLVLKLPMSTQAWGLCSRIPTLAKYVRVFSCAGISARRIIQVQPSAQWCVLDHVLDRLIRHLMNFIFSFLSRRWMTQWLVMWCAHSMMSFRQGISVTLSVCAPTMCRERMLLSAASFSTDSSRSYEPAAMYVK